MRKNNTKKKDIISGNINCKSTRGLNKKRPNNTGISSKGVPSKINSSQINSKQNFINNISFNKNIVYDQDFISYINKLSDIIKDLYKSNNSNFSSIKTILEKSNNNNKNNINNNNLNKNNKMEKKNTFNYDDNINSINSSINNIESTFNTFYNNAIVLFQKMKMFKETAETKKALLNRNNNKNNNINEENRKIRRNSFYTSPNNCFETKNDSLKQIININTKKNINDNLESSVDKIIKKAETDNNEFNKNENYEINVTRKNINHNNKMFTKTPGRSLKLIDNIP